MSSHFGYAYWQAKEEQDWALGEASGLLVKIAAWFIVVSLTFMVWVAIS